VGCGLFLSLPLRFQPESVIHRGCSALFRYLIFDVADVRLEWRQPSQVDQPVVSAAINIAGGVFAAVAGDNLTDQLDVFALHIVTFLESPGSTRRQSVEQPHGESNRKRAEAPRKGMDFYQAFAFSPDRPGRAVGGADRATIGDGGAVSWHGSARAISLLFPLGLEPDRRLDQGEIAALLHARR
jgi:hypothetical protein